MRYPAEKVLVLNETETRHENLKETARILAQFLARKVRTFGFGRSLLDLGGKSLRSPLLRRASDAAHGYFAPAQGGFASAHRVFASAHGCALPHGRASDTAQDGFVTARSGFASARD